MGPTFQDECDEAEDQFYGGQPECWYGCDDPECPYIHEDAPAPAQGGDHAMQQEQK